MSSPAGLAWRARHRTEREVERHLVDAQRRRSRFHRLLALTAAAVAIVAVIAASPLFSVRTPTSSPARRRLVDSSVGRQAARGGSRAEPVLAPCPPEVHPAPQRRIASVVAPDVSRAGRVQRPMGRSPSLQSRLTGVNSDSPARTDQARVVDASVRQEIVIRTVGSMAGVSSRLVLVHGFVGPRSSGRPGDGRAALQRRRAPSPTRSSRGGSSSPSQRDRCLSDASSCRLVRSIGRVGPDGRGLVASPDGTRLPFLSGREARSSTSPLDACSIGLVHPGEITSLAFSGTPGLLRDRQAEQLARIWSGSERHVVFGSLRP